MAHVLQTPHQGPIYATKKPKGVPATAVRGIRAGLSRSGGLVRRPAAHAKRSFPEPHCRRRRATLPPAAPPTLLPTSDARRLGAHHRVEPRVFRLRRAPALRDREAAGALRDALALVAPRARRGCHPLAAAVRRLDDACAPAASGVAPVARSHRGGRRPPGARSLGRRPRVRREGRAARHRRVCPVRRDRRVVRRARDRRGAPARPRYPSPNDASPLRPDERRRHVASDADRPRRGGGRSGSGLRRRPLGASPRERRRRGARSSFAVHPPRLRRAQPKDLP